MKMNLKKIQANPKIKYMNRKANNVIRIPTSLDGKFFEYWFKFLRPFHNLTDREIDVIACFVKHRYELSKVIKDNDILDKVTMSEDTKRKVREECNITLRHRVNMNLSRACIYHHLLLYFYHS